MIGRVCTVYRHFAQFYTKKLADRRSDRENLPSHAHARGVVRDGHRDVELFGAVRSPRARARNGSIETEFFSLDNVNNHYK
jgi:hypothetical protein